jgi:DnaD/phage-associated family protein
MIHNYDILGSYGMQFNIEKGIWHNVFAVPADVVETHIKNVSGVYVKTLLVLLCHNSGNLTSKEIGDKIGASSMDVEEAVSYWVNNNVLPKDVIGKSQETKPEQGVDTDKANSCQPSQNSKTTTHSPQLTSVEISKLIQSNSEIQFLFNSVEGMFGRPVTSTEQKVLVSMHEWIGLPVDVILMVIEYCITIGKSNIRYIEKTAAGWADRGITTHESAEKYLKMLLDKNKAVSQVKSCFGIYNRNLTTKEQKFIDSWTATYGFEINMIRLAYEKTIDTIGSLSFPYINSILVSWAQKGYKTPEQTQGEQQPVKKQLQKNGSFDINEFEEMGIFDIPDVK